MQHHGRRYWFNRFLERVKNGYTRFLYGVSNCRKTTVVGTLIAIIASLALIPFIGAEFIPESDQGQMGITVETEPGMSLSYTEDIVEQINEKLASYEDVMETNFVSMGSDAGMMG